MVDADCPGWSVQKGDVCDDVFAFAPEILSTRITRRFAFDNPHLGGDALARICRLHKGFFVPH